MVILTLLCLVMHHKIQKWIKKGFLLLVLPNFVRSRFLISGKFFPIYWFSNPDVLLQWNKWQGAPFFSPLCSCCHFSFFLFLPFLFFFLVVMVFFLFVIFYVMIANLRIDDCRLVIYIVNLWWMGYVQLYAILGLKLWVKLAFVNEFIFHSKNCRQHQSPIPTMLGVQTSDTWILFWHSGLSW